MKLTTLLAGSAAVAAAVLATLGASPAQQGSGQRAQNAVMVVYKSPT